MRIEIYLKKIFILFLCLIFVSCSVRKIDDKVIVKLSKDHKSFEIYQNLCQINGNGDNNSSYDLYLTLYNQGLPLVRLFEYGTIVQSFNNQSCQKSELKANYLKLVTNKMNYINDERRQEYFKEFLKNYNIIPATN